MAPKWGWRRKPPRDSSRRVVAESSVKSCEDTPAGPHPWDFQLSCACYANDMRNAYLSLRRRVMYVFVETEHAAAKRWNYSRNQRRRRRVVSPTTLSTSYTNALLSGSEAAITGGRCVSARARVLTRRRTEGFIEGSMNFERNIVNPSARWTEKVSPSTGNIVSHLPNPPPCISLSLSLSPFLSHSFTHSFFFPMRVIAASVSDL